MKIDTIHIQNYRCFRELEISLEKQITLFVGKNGAGKSAILDAAAVAAGTFLCGIEGGSGKSIQKEDARYEFFELEGMIDAQHQFPVTITAKGECDGNREITWMRSLTSANGKTTVKDARNLIEIAEKMQRQVMAGSTKTVLPILSYYGTGRLYARKKEKRDLQSLQLFNRQAGYLDCMAAEANEKMMLNWFEKMTMKSLQNQQKTGKAEKIPQLMAVENAVCRCFQKASGCSRAEVSFDLDTHRIMVEYEDQSGRSCFALNEMSDGYKNTLSMIGDIAYRMAVLNPQAGMEVLTKTPGIVLIDEIDLHLHPEWQQTILEELQNIFPRVQFLITSHAPAVIHSVKRENIRILDGEKVFVPTEQTYGRDANSILREVMHVWERPEEVRQLLTEFYQAIDMEKAEEAEGLLKQIEGIVGSNDPEVNGAKVTLDFEKMRGEWL